MWQSQQGSREVEYRLPKKITEVCFTDDDYQNLMLISEDPIDGKNIENINIEEITSGGDYCIGNIDGKISMTLVKEYGESLVKIIR